MSTASLDFAFDPRQEIANSISHGLALLAALVALPVMVVKAATHGDAAGIVGVSVFGTCMVVLYLASTLYHALPRGRAKRVFLLLDHSAIFLLIAGTYTPFTLNVLPPAWGLSLLGVVWGLAVVGIVLKSVFGTRLALLSTAIYLAMGWLVLLAAKPLWESLPGAGLAWLVAGGLCYTLGVGFFLVDTRVRHAHAVWHGFVTAGTACHVVAVMGYAI